MNKICFLILAHTRPEQLKRLIEALSFEHFDIYVHIDKKSNLNDFLHPNACFSEDRESISWGGFPMVQATLSLLNLSRDKGEYQYYCLLSGMDYPIKSNTEIYARLTKDNSEYLDFFQSDDIKWHNRYRYYYFRENRFIQKLLDYGLKRIMPTKNFPTGYTPYWGSQWWTLSNEAIAYLLDMVNSNPKLISFFKHCHVPDEMFFQTILCNSRFLDRIEKEPRYIDWSTSSSHPKTLIYNEDFELLKSSNALFARKFNSDDDAILDAIDSRLR